MKVNMQTQCSGTSESPEVHVQNDIHEQDVNTLDNQSARGLGGRM